MKARRFLSKYNSNFSDSRLTQQKETQKVILCLYQTRSRDAVYRVSRQEKWTQASLGLNTESPSSALLVSAAWSPTMVAAGSLRRPQHLSTFQEWLCTNMKDNSEDPQLPERDWSQVTFVQSPLHFARYHHQRSSTQREWRQDFPLHGTIFFFT